MKLVIEDEAGIWSVVPFAADEITIGRAAEGVTFRLGDRNVSRRHARFVRQNGHVFVEDLGSFTGTHVNGERIGGRRRLREGDVVRVGDYDLAVLPDEAQLAPGAPPPLPGGAPPAAPRAPTPAAPDIAPDLATALASGEAALAPGAAVGLPLPRARKEEGRRGVLRPAAIAGVFALAAGTALGYAMGRLISP